MQTPIGAAQTEQWSWILQTVWGDRKSTRLNSSHLVISYAVFCLKKKQQFNHLTQPHALLVAADVLDLVGNRAAIRLFQLLVCLGEGAPGHVEPQLFVVVAGLVVR